MSIYPDFIHKFCRYVQEASLDLLPYRVKIGELVRCQVRGDCEDETSSEYLLHLDTPDGSPAGFVRNHRIGITNPWTYQGSLATSQAEPPKVNAYATFKQARYQAQRNSLSTLEVDR